MSAMSLTELNRRCKKKKVARGLCYNCPKPRNKYAYFCDSCEKKRGTKSRAKYRLTKSKNKDIFKKYPKLAELEIDTEKIIREYLIELGEELHK